MRVLWMGAIVCIALASSAASGSCGPVLNEILADPAIDWDGSGALSSRDDEWVEIWNPGPGDLDLAGYFLGDADGSIVFGFEGSMAAGAHRIVYGSTAVAYQQSHGLDIYGLRLGNEGDTVQLRQAIGADTLLVDSYAYNNYEAEDDRSSGRRPDGALTWEMFDALNPYTGTTPPLGNGLAPTPGTANGEMPVAIEATTWGRMRALYR
ncbi:MAG: lamin tail domain-containing protein [Candidatus Eisenbacteria bacterium]|nr:lamin tail domain-containing protein [Candidatus Eisenbacteria bacterium]